MRALLEVRHCSILPTNTRAKLFKHTLFTRLPVSPAPVLQDAVKFLLCLSSPFLNGRDQVLFVRMSEVTCDIRVLERL